MSIIMPLKNTVTDDNFDIDMVCHSMDTIAYIGYVQHIYKTISQNLTAHDSHVRQKDIKIATKKRLIISIDTKTLKKICAKQEIPFAYDFVVDNIDNLEVKHHFYKLYVAQKQNEDMLSLEKLGDKKNMQEFYEVIKLVDINNVNVTINDQYGINFVESLRYKISSKYLKRDIRICCTDDIIRTVSEFCLPCMRSYYNGENCYLLPSAVVAYITFVNNDARFDKKSTPCHIINKYKNRGYFTILNKFETDQFDHIFPSQREQIVSDDKRNRLICDDIIDNQGNVIPVKKWLIEYAYGQKN
jgi:hypothetical protein